MTRSMKLALGAALLVAAAGGAHAQQTQPSQPAQPGFVVPPQQSYMPMEPKPSGNNYIAPDHFEKPPGYDQNRFNYPYGPHTGLKPS